MYLHQDTHRARHTSCGPENGVHANYVSITETIKLQFSHIRNSMIFNLKNTKVAVEVHAYQGRLHTKFEENRVKGFQDMSEQISSFFFVFSHT